MPSAITELVKWAVSVIGPAAGDPRTAASVRTPLGQLADRSKWLKMLSDRIWGAELQIIGRSGNVLEITAHGLPSNTPVRVFATSGGTIPAPLVADTVYYVRVVDANHIELSATSGPGAAITLTADGSGDQWASSVPSWITSMLVNDTTYGTGTLKDLVVWKAGPQTLSGAKTFADITANGIYKLAARGVSRVVTTIWVRTSDFTARRLPISAAKGTIFEAPIDLPHAQTLSAVHVRLQRTGLSGVFPAQKARFSLVRVNKLTGSESDVLAATEDPTGDIGDYEAIHTVDFSGLAHPIDTESYEYLARLEGELDPDGQTISVKSFWFDVQASTMAHWA